jgi:large subunit ribosomal protein L29
MTAKQIREKETSHLQAELLDQQKHLYDLRSQAVTEKLEDPSQLRKTKKDIARIKTIMRQRELEGASKNGKNGKEEPSTKSETKPRATKRKTTRTKTRTKTTARSKKKSSTRTKTRRAPRAKKTAKTKA